MSRSVPRDTFSRAPLIGAGVLIVMTVAFAAAARLSGYDASMPTTSPVAARDLRFENRPDGGIAVYDGRNGRAVAVIAPGSNGFLRATLRGLALRRKFVGDQTTIFHLTAWADGRLTLVDPARGGLIDLEAFGRTNEQAFARLLYDGSAVQ